MPTAVLERPAASPAPHAREHDPTPVTGGAGRPPRRPGYGGGGRGPRGKSDQWSIWLAALVTALIAALLTYLGILTQIWANMAGTQLPGA